MSVRMSHGIDARVSAAKAVNTPSPVYHPASKMTSTRTRCCETGRPIMADPFTGNTICSCQLQTGLPAYLSRVPSLPETVYGSGTGYPFAPSGVVGESGSPFYPMYSTESRKSAPPSVQSPYYYDHVMATHPYSNFFPGFDLNGARRKNATRENTNALKAWLHQHRKNPYPTKGEKIMLAVMTQMTLTQVSTWFANARRRLKKDCKIDGKDIDLSDIDVEENKEHNESMVSRLSDSESDITTGTNNLSTDLSDISDAEEQTTSKTKTVKKCVQRLFSPDRRDEIFLERLSSPEIESLNTRTEKDVEKENVLKNTNKDLENQSHVCNNLKSRNDAHAPESVQPKRKIWSISEIIG